MQSRKSRGYSPIDAVHWLLQNISMFHSITVAILCHVVFVHVSCRVYVVFVTLLNLFLS